VNSPIKTDYMIVIGVNNTVTQAWILVKTAPCVEDTQCRLLWCCSAEIHVQNRRWNWHLV